MPDYQELVRRQKALGDFGEFVLDNDDLQKILDEGCRLIAAALGADLAKVIEIDRATNTGLIRAGVGWKPGAVGTERVALSERSSEAFSIEKGEPVITRKIDEEDRFEFPDFMKDHGVVAIVNVPIFLPGRKPWGVLEVDAQEAREFDDEDIEFLRTYAMVLGPVVDRLQTVQELRESDEKLGLIVENARSYAIILSDTEDRITDWMAGSEEIFGWTADEVIGRPTRILFTPEDQAAAVPERELAAARGEGAAPDVRWHVKRDGGRAFLDGQTVALRDGDGGLRGYLKIARDITDRKRNEERQSVLLAELQHRVRNILAMIRSLAGRTALGRSSVEDYAQHLDARIQAMARTQALLTRAPGVGVDLETLALDELLAQAAPQSRYSVQGDEVLLSPKAAEVLTLAIHELATNSVKYGALGSEGGRIDISWRVTGGDDQASLTFVWRETGIRIEAEPRREGFGTELVTRRVAYELRGRGALDFDADGLTATLEFPLGGGMSVLDGVGRFSEGKYG
jgi:PAS domain S-box-containing protein